MPVVALANTPPVPAPVDSQYPAFQTGYIIPLISAATITASNTTNAFTLPYISVNAKSKLIVNVTAVSGTSTPGVTVNYFESPDGGTSYNATAALTSGALTATGEVWSSAAAGPIFNVGQLGFTVTGTTPSITFSVWLAVWNR
jgi:hypothetical protein